MNIINLLKKIAPKDKLIGLTLEVNSVPGLLNDLGICNTWAACGVRYEFKTIIETPTGHIRSGFLRNYSNYLRASVEAYAYFSARGVDTNLIDSKAEGTYVKPKNRKGFCSQM